MSVIYDAVNQVEQEAGDAIAGAVNDAQAQVQETARAIEAVARETVDKSVAQSVADLHTVVQQLVTRDQHSHDLIAEIHAGQASLSSRLDGLAAPVNAATSALASVADAVTSAAAGAVDDATDEDEGTPVSIQDVQDLPKTKTKKMFKKRK